MCSLETLISSGPQEWVQGRVHFNSFMEDLDDGAKCSRFAGGTELQGVLSAPEGRAALQGDVRRSDEWDGRSQ